MKKRVRAFLLALVMVFTTVAASLGNATVFKADELTIKLHYNRPDGDYTNWSVWFWSSDSLAAPLVEENGEMVATYPVPVGTMEVGYIVRLGEWEKKDIDKDQFIDVSSYLSGTIHVYVESGVEGHKIVEGDDVVNGTKLKSASYDMDKNVVEVEIVNPPEDMTDVLKIKSADGEVAIKEVTGADGSYIVSLEETLDTFKAYQIEFNGTITNIVMPIIYSTEDFEKEYTYTGNDLGATWTKEATTFRVWAPTAEAVRVNLYKGGSTANNNLIESIEMTADVNGTWVVKKMVI